MLKLTIILLISFDLMLVTIFWPAGSFYWLQGWLYMGLLFTFAVINVVYLIKVNPEVIEHRLRIGKGTKKWDKVWFVLFAPVFLAIYVTAGFDAVRFEWSTMTFWLYLPGILLFAAGTLLLSWSMGVNPFFEKTVRIQAERGHRVIDTGPYRHIRHPGYVGFAGWTLSAPLLLGSWWAFIPSIISVAALIIRTSLEDQTLCEELSGYVEYAERVRYRLIPNVW
jgi:protein-S-isoprenylcysteine O-methyltransferase Ste14